MAISFESLIRRAALRSRASGVCGAGEQGGQL
jgi:hypothetical protein